MNDPRLPSAEAVLQECFWGDYNLSAAEILNRLDRNEPGFDRFLFSKIMNNSKHPSRYLRALFPMETLKRFLEQELKRSGGNKRFRLVAANIFEQYDLVPEYQWRH
ncbi:MAG: hypothetical protein K9K64_01015 [Desulfohalobiaceae bacterium]|nr:hypothetical protein [Desulfohalobiaceae bacterium]